MNQKFFTCFLLPPDTRQRIYVARLLIVKVIARFERLRGNSS